MDKQTQNTLDLHARDLRLLRERIDRTYTELYLQINSTGSETGAPTDAPYIVAALDARLSDERALAEGWAIDLTDGGAGSTLTVAVNQTTLDGRYLQNPMTAALNMGGYAITNVGNVDGVDVSAFYSAYSTHIAAPNAHHDPVTAGDGIDLSGQQVAVDVTDFIDTSYGLTEASNNIRVNLASPAGLSFNSGALQIDDAVAGDGLTISSKVLAVGAGDGIDVSANAVAVDVTDILGSGLTESSNNIDLNWGTPTIGTIQPDASASAGTSTNPARSDHQHAIVAAAPGANSVSLSASAEGTATSFARSDHTHSLSQAITPTWTGLHTFQRTTEQVRIGYDGANYASFTVGSGGNLTVAPTGDWVFDPVGNDILPSNGYDLNIGSIQKKYLTLHAAELWVQSLVAQDTVATVGGRMVIPKSTTTLTRDLSNTNIATNGDFEIAGAGGADVFANWNETVDAGAITDETSLVHGGSHAAKLTAAGAGDGTVMTKDMAVTAGLRYTLTFWTRGDGSVAGRYWLYDISNSTYIISIVGTDIDGTEYGRVSVSFTAPAGCSSVRLALRVPSAAGDAYYDDVSLTLSTIYVKHNSLEDGDILWMESGGNVEFFEVEGSASAESDGYSYPTTRDLDGSGVNAWYAGDAVVNTGAADDGFIDMYSVSGIAASSTTGPTIVGNVRNSATYNDWSENWAIGNLDGLYGYGTDTYGVGLGPYDASAAHVTIDATDGIRFYDGLSTVVGHWQPGGDLTLGEVAASMTNLFWDASEGSLAIRLNTTDRIVFDSDGLMNFEFNGVTGSYDRIQWKVGGAVKAIVGLDYSATQYDFDIYAGYAYTSGIRIEPGASANLDTILLQIGASDTVEIGGAGVTINTVATINGQLSVNAGGTLLTFNAGLLDVEGDIAADDDIQCGGTISTNGGTNVWDLGAYSSSAPSATGYVTVTIDGTSYKLLAST